jgi:hypothetical protein
VFSSILGCWGWDWAGHNERVPVSFLKGIRRGSVAEHLEPEEDERPIFKHASMICTRRKSEAKEARAHESVSTNRSASYLKGRRTGNPPICSICSSLHISWDVPVPARLFSNDRPFGNE